MKTLVTVIALSLATAFSVNAQDNMKVQKNTESVKQQQQDMTKQIKSHTDRMTRDLTLSSDQTTRVMELNKGLYNDMASMKNESLKAEDMETMKMNSLEKYDSSLESILDEKQYEKYTSMKGKYMSQMQTKEKEMKNMPTEKSAQPSREMSK